MGGGVTVETLRNPEVSNEGSKQALRNLKVSTENSEETPRSALSIRRKT